MFPIAAGAGSQSETGKGPCSPSIESVGSGNWGSGALGGSWEPGIDRCGFCISLQYIYIPIIEINVPSRQMGMVCQLILVIFLVYVICAVSQI